MQLCERGTAIKVIHHIIQGSEDRLSNKEFNGTCDHFTFELAKKIWNTPEVKHWQWEDWLNFLDTDVNEFYSENLKSLMETIKWMKNSLK